MQGSENWLLQSNMNIQHENTEKKIKYLDVHDHKLMGIVSGNVMLPTGDTYR